MEAGGLALEENCVADPQTRRGCGTRGKDGGAEVGGDGGGRYVGGEGGGSEGGRGDDGSHDGGEGGVGSDSGKVSRGRWR